jgi:hypothetical protein
VTNKIGIGVEATFDSKAVIDGAKQVEQALQGAGKVKIDPVPPDSIRHIDEATRRLDQLLKLDAELRRRMKVTGQTGRSFNDIDWATMYPDAAARGRKLRTIGEYVGVPMHAPIPGAPPPRPPPGLPPRPPASGSGWGGFGSGAMGVAQAGLRAFGPAGGVAASALGQGVNAGASGGFATGMGAGLGGMLGGLLALGISKIVSGVMEKVGQAEDNNVQYDKLKRTIGDVGVAFEGLKATFTAGAEKFKVTYGEFGALGLQFARSGNLQAGQYTSLGDELGVGIGMSRSFGLDPSQGVGIMGAMRGLRITSDTQESRKFALLIGETIGKSGAFAKADEVMSAIGSYAESQTRTSMGAPNMLGYTGMLSGLTGSGIPGMDPMGAAGLIARVNGALTAGGAKGEASQFFSALVGNRMGLDPIQTQILREGGAFATTHEAFGKGSIAARFGINGPDGGTTWMQASIDELRRQYGGNKGMLAQATSNHLGIGMRQAMALLSVDPNQMGGMEKYAGDLTKLNAGGIGNLSKVLYGSDADRQSVAEIMYRRADIGDDEKRGLKSVMAGNDVEEQKRLLASMVSRFDQESTLGTDIRDSKTALDNIKTALADKAVPYLNEIRMGIMHMAGYDKGKSSEQIMREVVEADSDARVKSINGRYGEIGQNDQRIETLRHRLQAVRASGIGVGAGPEQAKRALKEAEDIQTEITALEKRQKELVAEKNGLLEKENERRQQELEGVTASEQARWQIEDAAHGGTGAGSSAAVHGVSPLGQKWASDPAFRALIAANEKEIGAPSGLLWAQLQQESGFNPGAVGSSGEQGMAQFMPGTRAMLEARLGRKFNPFDPKDAALMQKEYMRMNFARMGTWHGALRAYNGNINLPQTDAYASAVEAVQRRNATAAPPQLAAGSESGGGAHVTVDPLVVRHENDKGQPVAPPQTIQTRVTQPRPFGN